jgi:hypothetical protein
LNSIIDSNFTDTLQQDPLYDLTNSAAALLATTNIQFDIPVQDGMSLGFYKDSDSISTFRSTARSALKKKREKPSINTEKTVNTTPTHSVTFAPATSEKADEMSVSRMSDTASKVAGLETRFEQMEMQFTSSFVRLEAIISSLSSQRLATKSSTGSKQTPLHSANHPASASAGGSSTGVAGQGS